MLLNYVLLAILGAEALISILLSIPYGNRLAQHSVQFVSYQVRNNYSVAVFANVVLALIAILCLSNLNTCWSYRQETVLSDGLRIRHLTAQRDLCITGFTLFLMLLLRLVYNLIEINLELEEKVNAGSSAKEQCKAKTLVNEMQVDDLLAGKSSAATQ
ncbi:unnamed protein product [Albugo candida]|uniref:Endoplasmic reticulum transmembrane protein n=1 Tax=Albugo candida TaxID=65357 RepID=A0A024GM54_9STRA|nr:unnamed protein product [Albugo candida]|eukprot:CCI47935.1 unnamed protein product [Albugo candida]